jgi:hypothetical protein
MRTLSRQSSTKETAQEKSFRGKILGGTGRSPTISPLSTGQPMLQRQCACGGGCPRCQDNLTIQPKLQMSEPGDAFEQEADQIADRVMRMPEPTIQHHMEPDEEEEGMIQREAMSNSITPLQRSTTHQDRPSEVPPIVDEVINSPGQSLDTATRTFMESRFGHDFSNVQIHTDDRASRSAEAVRALAYTIGSHIAFATGQYTPHTTSGLTLLAHELVHTVQQQGQTFLSNSQPNSRTEDTTEGEAHKGEKAVLQNRSVSLHTYLPVLARQDAPSTEELPEQIVTAQAETEKPRSTWGWGAPESTSIYEDCQSQGQSRDTFLASYLSMKGVPSKADDALGVTGYDKSTVLPPINTKTVVENNKTYYKLQPTHAEMPKIASFFTAAGEFQEGQMGKQYVLNNCKIRDYPIKWKITTDGAEKIKEGEEEHCNDIRHAFRITLALYASTINNVAAAERLYSSKSQAEQDALNQVGIPQSQWMNEFEKYIKRSEKRDDKKWHTPKFLKIAAHRQTPDDNGCSHFQFNITANAVTEIGKHSSIEVIE